VLEPLFVCTGFRSLCAKSMQTSLERHRIHPVPSGRGERSGYGVGVLARYSGSVVSAPERQCFPMFELIITECEGSPIEWEWRVCDASGRPLLIGWQRSRKEANHGGEKALFKLLASGRNIHITKNGPLRGH